METPEITLSEAYMIENLRKQNVPDEAIINIKDQDINSWNDLDERFDFIELKQLAEANKNKFTSIILEGYQVKFLTLNGLINLVQLKFNKERDVDFIVHDDGISNLVLDESDHPKIKQFLSQNWKMVEENSHLAIRLVNV